MNYAKNYAVNNPAVSGDQRTTMMNGKWGSKIDGHSIHWTKFRNQAHRQW